MDYNYNTSTPKAVSFGKSVLGLFLTFIMIPLLVVNGYFIALKTTVLQGNNINDLLDNCNFYDTVQTAIVDELFKNTESLGLSKDALNELFPQDMLSDAAEKVTNAITSNETVDLSYMKDECIDVAEATADSVADSVLDSFENTSKIFDIKSLTSNTTLQQFEKDYGIHITDNVINELETQFGTTTIDLSIVDTAEVKAIVSTTLHDKVYPSIENAFDEYIAEANDLVNRSISEFNDEYNLDGFLKLAENTLSAFLVSIIVISIIILALFAVQLLVYKPHIYKAFKNFSLASLISGIIILTSGMFILYVKDMLLSELADASDSITIVIKDFIDTNLSSVNNMIIAIGIIDLVVFIACIIISSLLKKKLSADRY